MELELFEAVLREEDNRRFRCIIVIDGKRENCYVPCSSRLSKYIPIEDKRVLIKKIQNKKTMPYRLIAVMIEEDWIVVDFILLNSLVKEYYEDMGYKVLQEQIISSGYKADLVIEKDKKTIVEIKGILSMDEVAIEPINNSDRTMR